MYDYIHSLAVLAVSLLQLKNEFDKRKHLDKMDELNEKLFLMERKVEKIECDAKTKFMEKKIKK
jgi:hypothetical protein